MTPSFGAVARAAHGRGLCPPSIFVSRRPFGELQGDGVGETFGEAVALAGTDNPVRGEGPGGVVAGDCTAVASGESAVVSCSGVGITTVEGDVAGGVVVVVVIGAARERDFALAVSSGPAFRGWCSGGVTSGGVISPPTLL